MESVDKCKFTLTCVIEIKELLCETPENPCFLRKDKMVTRSKSGIFLDLV